MNRRRWPRALLAAGLLGLSGAVVWAQASPPSSSEIDNLFTDNGTAQTPPDNGAEDTGAAQSGPAADASSPSSIRPDDPTQDQKIHYFGSIDIYGLVGSGWATLPDPANIAGGLGNEGYGTFTASLGFEVRPAPQLRLLGTLSYSWPSGGPQLTDLMVDYSVLDAVFFRLGIFSYTWGISQFFQLSNLPARSAGWVTSDVPLWEKLNIIAGPSVSILPLSVKMSIPFGLNSLSFLARFDLQNYGFPNPATPDPRYAGYGLELSVVTGSIEWVLSGFWQRRLTPRSSLSLKTSFLGFDFSAETTMAFPVSFHSTGLTPIATTGGGIFVGGLMQRIYPTAMLGLSREWPDARIKLFVEYAYNGERDAGATSWLVDGSGPGGHNSVAVLRFANVASSGITMNLLWQQNWSDGSGQVSPFFEISPVPLTTIQFGPVFLYGPSGGEVFGSRLVPGTKQLEFLLLVKVSDSYRQ